MSGIVSVSVNKVRLLPPHYHIVHLLFMLWLLLLALLPLAYGESYLQFNKVPPLIKDKPKEGHLSK